MFSCVAIAPADEEERYRKLASSDGPKDDDDLFDAGDDIPPLAKIESARSARTQHIEMQERKLEESWMSLNLFERSHKGRLSIDMESEPFFIMAN